ncbi:MAG: hypothetical protein Q7R45_07220 [Sulfuricaulis sp.]|nr:hypothetical protein [Sulfuricaulis sp.]
MAERGVFAVDRGVFDHPVFALEPFTEREAWLWLIGSAAWKAKRVRAGRATVDLERGECAFATRFLATRWQWSESRVRRFLNRLKIDAMVTTLATHETTRITICNYDKYAFGRRTDDDENDGLPDAPPTHRRRKEEELNKDKKEEVKKEIELALRADDIVDQPINSRETSDWPKDYRDRFWNAYPRKQAKKAAFKALDKLKKTGEVTFAKLMAGVANIPIGEPIFIPHPATWLNRGGWDDEPVKGNGYGATPGQNRTDLFARPPPTNADAILAGMGRVAARIGNNELSDRRREREIQGRGGTAGGADAERSAAGGDTDGDSAAAGPVRTDPGA